MSTSEAVVTCENGSVCVPIYNFRGITAYLEDGLSLGTIHTIKSVKKWNSDNVEPPELPVGVVASVESANPLPNDHISQLLLLLNVNFDKLSEVEAQKLKDLVIEYHDVFALDDSELGCTNILTHSIEPGDSHPIQQQPYRTPMVRREKMAGMIDEMQAQGEVWPSSSPWASPVVLVPKEDGSLRFCVDYRSLYSVTKKDVYPSLGLMTC